MNIYEELNINKNATQDDIKKEYKKFCKENHPDIGGNEKEFTEKKGKFDILLNLDDRAYYDQTGKTKSNNSDGLMTKIFSFINDIVKINPDNIEEFIVNKRTEMTDYYESKISGCWKNIDKIKAFKERITVKKDEGNIVIKMLDGQIKDKEQEINMYNLQKDNDAKAFEFLLCNFVYKENENEFTVHFPTSEADIRNSWSSVF
jgi:curved DNA-binding protein CbpA